MAEDIIPDKTCSTCKGIKPLTEFRSQINQHGKRQYNPWCKQCVNRRRRVKTDKRLTTPIHYSDDLQATAKLCGRCKVDRPIEAFKLRKGKPISYCRDCEKSYFRERYLRKNPNPRWRHGQPQSPEARRAKKAAYRESHRDQLRAAARVYHHTKYKTPERLEWRHDYSRKYQQANKAAIREKLRNRRRAHPDKVLEHINRRRARKAAAPAIEKIDRQAIIQRDKSTCYICLRLLLLREVVLDHVVPLSRNGSHTADNLRVACRSCNSWKGPKLLSELDLTTRRAC